MQTWEWEASELEKEDWPSSPVRPVCSTQLWRKESYLADSEPDAPKNFIHFPLIMFEIFPFINKAIVHDVYMKMWGSQSSVFYRTPFTSTECHSTADFPNHIHLILLHQSHIASMISYILISSLSRSGKANTRCQCTCWLSRSHYWKVDSNPNGTMTTKTKYGTSSSLIKMTKMMTSPKIFHHLFIVSR